MNELAKGPMTVEEARTCADQINANMTNIRVLVLALYERKGWAALGYNSWRDCVVKEFNQSQSYLYQQLGAAQTARNISAIAENSDMIPESQLRSLVKLKDNPERQREVWRQAVAIAPDGKVTAAHVSKTIKGMMVVGQEKPRPAPQPKTSSDAIRSAAMAILQLQSIGADDPRRDQRLRTVINWIRKNTAQSEPKIRARRWKIPPSRRKQRWLLNNQIPIDMTPVG